MGRWLILGMAAALLCGCAGVLDHCGEGLPAGPPGQRAAR